MAYFTHISTMLGAGFPHTLRAIDLKIWHVGASFRLYVADSTDSGISAYTLRPGMAPSLIGTLDYQPGAGTFNLVEISMARIGNGLDVLLPAARYDMNAVLYKLDINGSIPSQNGTLLDTPHQITGHLSHTEMIQAGPNQFAITTGVHWDGLDIYNISTTGNASFLHHVQGLHPQMLSGISDMTEMSFGKRSYLFVTTGPTSILSSYRIGPKGWLDFRDSVLPGDASGFANPTCLETAEVGNNKFLLMGDWGTSSITVYHVSRTGMLTETDHVMDTTNTSFFHISAMATLSYKGHAYVIAGGADYGITLFELNSDGTLFALDTLANQPGMSLHNVQTITAAVMGSEIQVFASGADMAGVTQLSLNLSQIGAPVNGSRRRDHLVGTPGDDTLVGKGGRDHLDGGAGNDHLIDGRGRDVLTGGPGNDVFIFREDSQPDRIVDFTFGQDRIDLSDYFMVHSMNDINIVQKSWGYAIHVNQDVLWVTLAASQAGQTHHFAPSDFIF